MIAKSASARRHFWPTAILALVIIAVCLFLYFDRHNQLSTLFRAWGIDGILVAIVLRALLSVTPIPSEGLMVLLMKIYSVWWGVFYCWLGSLLGSLVVFIIARKLGRPILQSIVTPTRFEQVDGWVREKGIPGLLFVQLLPIPGFIISYVIGTMPSVSLWTYVWTGAISIIPYYVGSALIYLGVSKHLVTWLAAGIAGLALLWLVGYQLKKKWQRV